MLTDIDFPNDLHYSSDKKKKPLEFYLKCLRESKKFDLKLGYFSSNAIRTLSIGFAQFIYKGGVFRVITNHFLSEEDKKLIEPSEADKFDYTYIENIVNNDLEGLNEVLSETEQHFFDCLKYLLKKNRLILVPVKIKPNNISHYKQGLFKDVEQKIYFNGSCNFTYSGIIENGESIDISRGWGSNAENNRIENEEKEFEKIINKEHPNYIYLNPEHIEAVIKQKGRDINQNELVENDQHLFNKLVKMDDVSNIIQEERKQYLALVEEEKKKISFPFKKGPFEYQQKALSNWIKKGYCGIFAMATGTGKTITSLNCLLHMYEESGYYRALILVPTKTLVEQWKDEVEKFNFSKTILVSSDTSWKGDLTRLKNDYMWESSPNFIIISTYASFQNSMFQNLIKNLPNETLLIADEAHNLGAPKTQEAITKVHFNKRIALSATPKREFDPEGNSVIEKIFNDSPPYCFSYSMEQAIESGALTRYFYYPKLVHLESDELSEYYNITNQLIRHFDSDNDSLADNDAVKKLLIKRKSIIHKARNKLNAFREVAQSLHDNGDLKNCFVYVPEGFDHVENNSEPYYKIMMNILAEINSKIRQSSFLGGDSYRDNKLRGFREGRIDVLISMKCLDEGVDVPRTEVGIFAASTGNPRQFIQRRGRLLRNHPNKNFAYIYDLVVSPNIFDIKSENINFKLERSLFKSELTRVAYFASLSENFYYSKEIFHELSNYFKLDIDSLIWELKNAS